MTLRAISALDTRKFTYGPAASTPVISAWPASAGRMRAARSCAMAGGALCSVRASWKHGKA
jgi:hypothetical protein